LCGTAVVKAAFFEAVRAFCGKVATFCAFLEAAFATKIAFAIRVEVTTFAGKAARAIFEIVSVTAEMRLASDSAAFWGALVKIAFGTVYRFLIWVLTVKPRLVKCGAGCSSEVALAIVTKTATAVVIIETHFVNLSDLLKTFSFALSSRIYSGIANVESVNTFLGRR
jgi:hypothetical protein